jgi:hypothetical protein
MAQSLRSQRALARHRDRCRRWQRHVARRQINGHHSLRRLHKFTQNAGRRYVIGGSHGHRLRALLLHAKLHAPAEQQPRDDPMKSERKGCESANGDALA